MSGHTLKSLSELRGVSRDMKARAKAEEEARLKAALEARAKTEGAREFEEAMAQLGGVRRQGTGARVATVKKSSTPPGTASLALRARAAGRVGEPRVVRLSDEVDPSDFIESADGLTYRRPYVLESLVKKLHRGEWAVEAHVDLHGLFVDEARDEIDGFVREARIRGMRCLRIVHGQGYGSDDGRGVLKTLVRRWLKQMPEVMAFVQAPPKAGDGGAVIVLLTERRAG